MRRLFFESPKDPESVERRSLMRNWEDDIVSVSVETCHSREDVSGFRAVFHLAPQRAIEEGQQIFIIGGSYLAQRLESLSRAGYDAPMTKKALKLLEAKRFAAMHVEKALETV